MPVSQGNMSKCRPIFSRFQNSNQILLLLLCKAFIELIQSSLISPTDGATVAIEKMFAKNENLDPVLCPNVGWNKMFH